MKNLLLLAFLILSYSCSDSGTPQTPQDSPSVTADTVQMPAIASPEESAGDTAKFMERNAAPPPPSNPKEFSAGAVTFKLDTPESENNAALLKVEGRKPVFYKEFPIEGAVKDAFLLDLNGDGYSEIYLAVTNPTGQVELKGYASYRDRSAGEIYVNDLDVKRQPGSDQVFVNQGKLYRHFTTPGGELQKLKYELKKGETSFVLSASLSSN